MLAVGLCVIVQPLGIGGFTLDPCFCVLTRCIGLMLDVCLCGVIHPLKDVGFMLHFRFRLMLPPLWIMGSL